MTKLDWDKAKRRPRRRRKSKPRWKDVHPNSMAATKWGRRRWRTSE